MGQLAGKIPARLRLIYGLYLSLLLYGNNLHLMALYRGVKTLIGYLIIVIIRDHLFTVSWMILNFNYLLEARSFRVPVESILNVY